MTNPDPTSKGEAASEQEVTAWMESLGFELHSNDVWYGNQLGPVPKYQARFFYNAPRQRDTQLIAKLRELGPKKDELIQYDEMANVRKSVRNKTIDQFETLFQQIEKGEV